MTQIFTRQSIVALVLVAFSATFAPAEDTFRDQIQQKLAKAINNKTADYKHDKTNNVRVLGAVVGKRGKEFTGHGKTGVANITASTEGSGLQTKYIYDCVIPWSGAWTLKNFSGVAYEYRKEEKKAEGKYKMKIKVHLLGGKIEYLEAKSLTALDHDSRKMPVTSIESRFLKDQDYLRKAIFN